MLNKTLIYTGSTESHQEYLEEDVLGSFIIEVTDGNKNHETMRRMIRGYIREGYDVNMLMDNEDKWGNYTLGESKEDVTGITAKKGYLEDFHRLIRDIKKVLDFRKQSENTYMRKLVYIVDDLNYYIELGKTQKYRGYTAVIDEVLAEGYDKGIIFIGVTDGEYDSPYGNRICYTEDGVKLKFDVKTLYE